jgi:hypothetical protein
MQDKYIEAAFGGNQNVDSASSATDDVLDTAKGMSNGVDSNAVSCGHTLRYQCTLTSIIPHFCTHGGWITHAAGMDVHARTVLHQKCIFASRIRGT